MVQRNPGPNDGSGTDNQSRAVVNQDSPAGNLCRGVDVDGGRVSHNGHGQSRQHIGNHGDFLLEESVA